MSAPTLAAVRSAGAVSADLRKLAQRPAHAQHAVALRSLADHLGTADAALWARVDLFTVFDDDAVLPTGEPGRGTRLSFIDLVRNVLLVLPVLITWIGIFFAVRGYRALLAAPTSERNVPDGASFLQMWIGGFGRRTWWTFDKVALLDAAAIVLVIAVSLAGGWLRRRFELEDERERRESVRELRAALTDATLVLASANYDAPDLFGEDLVKLVPVYQEAVQRLVDVESSLSSSLARGAEHATELTEASGELARSSQLIAASAAELQQHVTSFENEVGELETKVSSLVGGATDLGAQLTPVRQGLDKLVTKMNDLNIDQQHVAQELATIADNPRAAARAAADTAKALAETVSALPEQMRKAGDAIVAVVDSELAERRSAAGALAGAGQAANELAHAAERATSELAAAAERAAGEMTGSAERAVGVLAQSSEGAARQLARSVDALADAPRLVLPDLGEAASLVTGNLERSRDLADTLAVALEAAEGTGNGSGDGNGTGPAHSRPRPRPRAPWRRLRRRVAR